ncbi:hypothetical protein [Burkholderia stagnalis]|uniref:hypothetical protein n=1 Tax=Burkholderia stagnalis TaxID=1503054 RepID=UPI000F5E96DD|nr:hypothetical protein [Burkholderia stagnalis]
MNIEEVDSIRFQERVKVIGFECVDPNLHMIEWLGRGRDVRQFIVNDVETELYVQDRNAQVLSIECTSEPEYETKIKQQGTREKGIVSQFAVTFPLSVRVKAGTGAIWALLVRQSYNATALDVPENRQLMLNFLIVGQQEMK